ncbi:MAG: hypothetical protein Ct9H300mP1_19920 [Planctomycetaceae bacterium]|nr:MAG: hypothetical protein Ct9H300mP1_19920 [Planctomycetaceae bacterium]
MAGSWCIISGWMGWATWPPVSRWPLPRAPRGSGNMRTPMVVLGLVSLLNVIVSTVLVFGAGARGVVGGCRVGD